MNIKIITLFFCLFMAKDSICFSQSLPIKPTRTISFSTNEGSYMDVDLSPDGKTIVFNLLGDLYTVPAAGGTTTQLTRGLAYNYYPVWSPDGKQIACINDATGSSRVTVMNADGSEARVLDLREANVDLRNYDDVSAQPAWTPDGQYIAADGRLYHLAGGSMPLPMKAVSNVQFSLDGHFIYYGDDNSLVRYDCHTGVTKKIATVPQYKMRHDLFDANQHISPDGQWLAYISGTYPEKNSSLRVRNLSTGEDRLLAGAVEGQYCSFGEHFCFTPDSKSVLIGFGGKLHRIDVPSGADHIIPFEAHVNADLGPFDYNTFKVNDNDSLHVRFTRSANSSPDGKNLVFTALNRIYTMKIPDGVPHILTKQRDGQFQPSYSPDGKWIAYVTWNDTAGGSVWRVRAVGGKPEKLTRVAGHYQTPAWSPDGTKLAVVKGFEFGGRFHGGWDGELRLINIKDRVSHQLADSINIDNSLSFSKDGSTVIAMSGQSQLSILKLIACATDCHKKKILAISDGNKLVSEGQEGLFQATFSPDYRYIVYGNHEDLYLVPYTDLGTPAKLNSLSGLRPVIRFAVGGYDPQWEQGGKLLSWSYGNHYYRINPDKIMQMGVQAAKDSAANGVPDEGFLKLNVIPDETVTMNVSAAKQYAAGIIVLRNVRIISMKGDEVIEQGTIVIKDGRFIAVGPMSDIPIPDHAKVIDLKGKTIIPGMIDLHDHVSAPTGVFVNQFWPYLTNLAYGVTTARDPSAYFDDFGYAELLQTGQMIGPRLLTVGWIVLGGDSPGLGQPLESLEDARETVHKRAELGATTVKQYVQNTRLQRQWLLMACHEADLDMTNEGDFNPRSELAMMKDGSTGVEHAYNWGNIYRDVIQFAAGSGTWHTPTLLVMGEKEAGLRYFEDLYRKQPDNKLANFWPEGVYKGKLKTPESVDTVSSDFVYKSSVEARILKHGGHIGLGAHGNDAGIGSQWELWALQMGGLTNMEALRVATLSGAEALGMQQDLGSIEVGKIADLIILDKNPLDDIHNTMSIRYVMKDGILYEGNTLNEVWPISKKLPAWRMKDGVEQNIDNSNFKFTTSYPALDDDDKN